MGALMISAIGSIIGTVVLTTITLQVRKYYKNRSIRAILSFSEEGELLIVFSQREQQEQALLPRMATEDLMAINNIISLLIKIGWPKRIRIRSVQNLSTSDKSQNIVTLGGPKVNPFTKETLEQLQNRRIQPLDYSRYDPQFEFVKDEQHSDRWLIKRGEHTKYESKAYDVKYAEAAENPELEIEDPALLIKVKNPRDPNSRTKVLVLAGIRGIGTWAAADYLRKFHVTLYNRKSGFPWEPMSRWRAFRKSGDFATVIKGTYKNLDIIVDPECREFIDLS
jgi:hypothetical protein